MLTQNQQVFIRIPSESDVRVLHPACVTDVADDQYTLALEEPDLDLVAGGEIVVFYESRREFMQQSARISAISAPESDPFERSPGVAVEDEDELGVVQTIGLELVGDPVSAENRKCYRVSTVVADIPVTVGAEPRCRLLDVSATGFAVAARSMYRVGNTIDVTIEYDGQDFSGCACVQSVREMLDGRIRYGLHCLADRFGSSSLERGLAHISSSIQRRQMRRLRGAG